MKTVTPNARETEVVAAGAALLDQAMPGWAGRIDLNHLDLMSGAQCVLGQLFNEAQTKPLWQTLGFDSLSAAQAVWTELGRPTSALSLEFCDANYTAGVEILNLITEEPEEGPSLPGSVYAFGFDEEWDYGTSERLSSYAGLDAAWALAVKDRHERGVV